MAIVVGIPVVLIAIVALNAPREPSKDYRFPRVVIEATVRPDGSLVLDEHRTYDFTGEFSSGYFTVDWPEALLEDFTVSENGKPFPVIPSDIGGTTEVIWSFAARDEVRTFDIHYVARCAVDVYSDGAHLLWQFVGTGWEKVTDRLQVTVHLPDVARKPQRRSRLCPPPAIPTKNLKTRPLAEGDVRAWGHGPFAGTVRIVDPQTVRYTVRDLQPFTFVEGSILFPPAVVPFAQMQTNSSAAEVVEEERRLAEETDALRRQHELETGLVIALFALLPLFLVAMIIVARRRDRVPDVPRHLQGPPEEIHPAELAVLWSTVHGNLHPKTAYRAQLLHLVRTGVLRVTPVGRVSEPEDFLVQRGKDPGELDREFVAFLFAGDGQGVISMNDVRAKGARRERLTQWWKRVGARSKRTVTKVVSGRKRVESTASFLFAGAVAAYGYWRSFGFEDGGPLFEGLVGPLAAFLIPEAVVGYMIAKRFMPPRLPDTLRERIARWGAFRRFLTEFSTLPDAPALGVIIWEDYLVYAVALGVADEVEDQVRGLVPAERLPEPWPGAPRGDDGYRFYHHSIHSTPAHTAANAATAVGWSSGWGSSSSGGSSSGGGGGFSGGGGGGGGGTGGGAS